MTIFVNYRIDIIFYYSISERIVVNRRLDDQDLLKNVNVYS